MLKNFIFVILICFSNLVADNIKIVTEVFPPFQIVDKNNKLIGGISVDIVRAIQKEVGNKNKIKVYPWVRAIKLTEIKPNYALFSTLRTKDREHKFKWVGPIAKMQLVFFKKAGSKIVVHSIEDAKKVHKVGVTRDVANYDILKAMGFKNLDVLRSGTDEKNIKKLIKNRIDLWPSLKSAGLYNAKKMGVSNKIEPIDNIVVFKGNLYIAFSKTVSDKIIQKWQKALDKLRKQGFIKKIINKYK